MKLTDRTEMAFSLRALYDAIDAQRQARGISWAQVIAEMNGSASRSAGHRLSRSTVVGLRGRRVAEGDGVLQMIRWLKRTPESFIRGAEAPAGPGTAWASVPANKVLRFDTRKLHSAVDAHRQERDLSWKQAAAEIEVGTSVLTRLSGGGRTSFPQVMRILGWLGSPTAEFTRLADR